MIRVLAIDDEPLALRQLISYVQRVPFLELAAQCQSAIDAREFLRHDSVDVIFCDINMPDLDGMSFVKSLVAPPLVVFTTAYSEYAVEGFRVEAVDYLLKPFGLDEFRRAAERVQRRLQDNASAQHPSAEASSPDVLFVRADHRTISVDVSTIRYVQGLSEYVRLHLTNATKPVTTLMAIKTLEERLPRQSFMRIHKSYIVSLKHITEIAKSRITLDDGTTLPIGDAYRGAFETYLHNKML